MKIKASKFNPQGEVKGLVVIIHGMSEHRKRYDSFANILKDNGFAVLTYDQVGHGESIDDVFGYFGKNGWETLLKTGCEMIETIKKDYPNVPCFVFGHSMGSIVARGLIAHHDDLFDGVILSGAPNYQNAAPSGRQIIRLVCALKGDKKTSNFLKDMVEGAFSKAIENPRTELDWLSFNEENVNKYIEDPFCGQQFTNRGYYDLMTGLMDMHDTKHFKVSNPDLPIYFMAGKYDPCTGYEAGLSDSIETLKKAGYHNIDKTIYENSRHEILNDNDRDAVMADAICWLNSKVQ